LLRNPPAPAVAHSSVTVVQQPAVSPFSIINWWREHQDKFPKLAFFPHKLLSVPAFIVASAAGQTITEQRTSLKPDTIDSICF